MWENLYINDTTNIDAVQAPSLPPWGCARRRVSERNRRRRLLARRLKVAPQGRMRGGYVGELSVNGQLRQVAPHPSAGRAADTFPLGGRLSTQTKPAAHGACNPRAAVFYIIPVPSKSLYKLLDCVQRLIEIGDDVSIGHNVTIHGAKICNGALIGMGSVVLDHAVVGEGAIIAAGSVVLSKTIVEPGSIYAGVPAKFVKKVDPEQAKEINQKIAKNYHMYSSWYKE